MGEVGTRRWSGESTTYYEQEETITAVEDGWEHYEARCVSGRTPAEAQANFAAGQGARITGKRRVQNG